MVLLLARLYMHGRDLNYVLVSVWPDSNANAISALHRTPLRTCLRRMLPIVLPHRRDRPPNLNSQPSPAAWGSPRQRRKRCTAFCIVKRERQWCFADGCVRSARFLRLITIFTHTLDDAYEGTFCFVWWHHSLVSRLLWAVDSSRRLLHLARPSRKASIMNLFIIEHHSLHLDVRTRING